MSSSEIDQNLLAYAKQVAAIPRRISEDEGVLAPGAPPNVPVAVAPIAVAPVVETQTTRVSVKHTAVSVELPRKTDKKLRTAEELSNLILATLRQVDDFPRQGFTITVYGFNPWNAHLTIRPEAGPSKIVRSGFRVFRILPLACERVRRGRQTSTFLSAENSC
jgi:hypothetical protein